MRSGEDLSTAPSSAPAPQTAPAESVAVQENACAVCAEWKREMETERRELTSQNRELTSENRNLWKEICDLREKCARFEERQYQRTSQDGGEAVGSA